MPLTRMYQGNAFCVAHAPTNEERTDTIVGTVLICVLPVIIAGIFLLF